mmetsp:Transcript_144772/g.361020  ORF Transcript_144772/g.361020 Transcript_144772/m.361020 type:complete len:239 (+) Transcript_144772:2753-3469(+)
MRGVLSWLHCGFAAGPMTTWRWAQRCSATGTPSSRPTPAARSSCRVRPRRSCRGSAASWTSPRSSAPSPWPVWRGRPRGRRSWRGSGSSCRTSRWAPRSRRVCGCSNRTCSSRSWATRSPCEGLMGVSLLRNAAKRSFGSSRSWTFRQGICCFLHMLHCRMKSCLRSCDSCSRLRQSGKRPRPHQLRHRILRRQLPLPCRLLRRTLLLLTSPSPWLLTRPQRSSPPRKSCSRRSTVFN